MKSTDPMLRDASSAYGSILERTLQAYRLARNAATALADGLATKSEASFRFVDQAEADLDKVDREIDSAVAPALLTASPEEAHVLLAEMKMVIDLERIGDLVASVAGYARKLGVR
ncbi:MAG: PhoU domain-containing protein, partial [Terriglobales bacterium]